MNRPVSSLLALSLLFGFGCSGGGGSATGPDTTVASGKTAADPTTTAGGAAAPLATKDPAVPAVPSVAVEPPASTTAAPPAPTVAPPVTADPATAGTVTATGVASAGSLVAGTPPVAVDPAAPSAPMGPSSSSPGISAGATVDVGGLSVNAGVTISGGGGGWTGAGTPPPWNPTPGLCAPANTFSYALCTCDSLTQVGGLEVDSGPSGTGSVGVNGFSSIADISRVSGSWVSWQQWTAGTAAHIGGSLRSGTNAVMAGAVSVGKDLWVRQNLLGVGLLSVGGGMSVGGDDLFVGLRSIAGGRTAPTGRMQPPCGCDAGSRFDVVGAVEQARTMNDNAARGIPSGARLDIGFEHASLDTGRYYFRGVHDIGIGVLRIRGNVSIYIDGSLDEIGAEAIRMDPGATLDLYVSGAVRLLGFTPLGDRHSPSSFRLFVGGEDRLSISAGLQELYGSIYAPAANIVMAGVTVVWGSLFAREVISGGILAINHAGAAPTCTPPVTPPPPIPPPTSGGDCGCSLADVQTPASTPVAPTPAPEIVE